MVISAVDKFSRPLKKLQSGLSKIGSLAAGIGKGLGKVALGITAAVGAVSLVVARYTTMLDKIGKTSEKLGIDPLFLQKLRFAAEQTGVKVEALDMGLQRFIRRTAEAARGTGEAKQALADLGIELFNNDGSLRNVESGKQTGDGGGRSVIGADKEELKTLENEGEEVVDVSKTIEESGGKMDFEEILKMHGI